MPTLRRVKLAFLVLVLVAGLAAGRAGAVSAPKKAHAKVASTSVSKQVKAKAATAAVPKRVKAKAVSTAAARRSKTRPAVVPAAAVRPSPAGPVLVPAAEARQDYERAVRLYHEGGYEEALALLDRFQGLTLTDRENRLVRFFQGVIAARMGQRERVERVFSGSGSLPAGLEAYAAYFAAEAAFKEERWPAAADRFQAYLSRHPDGVLRRQALLSRAASLANAGKTDEAMVLYLRIRDEDRSTGEADLALGRLYEGRGRAGEALEAYERAVESAGSGRVWAEARRRYEALLQEAVAARPGEGRALELARMMARSWRLEECLAFIEGRQAEGGSPAFLDELALEKGRVLLWLNRVDEAFELYDRAAGQATPDYRARFREMRALCLTWQGRWAEAAAGYLDAAGAAAADRADRNFFRAGELFLKAEMRESALKAWESVRAWALKGSLADDLLWTTAWYHYDRREWKAAAEAFGELRQKYPDRDLGRAAFYWLGRTLERQGLETEAAAVYQEAAVAPRSEYYRLLALERLRALRPGGRWALSPGPEDQAAMGDVQPSLPARASETGALWLRRDALVKLGSVPNASARLNQALARTRTLAEAGVLDLALLEAEAALKVAASETLVKPRPLARDRLRRRQQALQAAQAELAGFVAAYYASTEQHVRLARLLNRRPGLLPGGAAGNEALRRRWPLVNIETVKREAEAHGLDPMLLLAVIRAESSYRETAVSSMSAIGLMQILPSTGRRIADLLGLSGVEPEALFEPETNIRLGSWYLGALLREFRDQAPLALAAYNAGPFRVKRWLEQTGRESLDEFIEQIPYDQTREYVKKILTFQYTYGRLYLGRAPALSLHRPLIKDHLDEVNF